MEVETKKCPYCGEEILSIAKKCKHCGEWLNTKDVVEEKSPCPICGEMIEVNLTVCPYCKEPVWSGTKNNALGSGQINTNHVKYALWAIALALFLSIANTMAEQYPSGADGLVGLLVGLGNLVPPLFSTIIDGIGTLYLLWCVADYMDIQKKREGKNNNIKSLLLKSFAIVYFIGGVMGCFAEEEQFAALYLFFAALMLLLLFVNTLTIRAEKDPRLVGIGNAFFTVFIVTIIAIKNAIKLPDSYWIFEIINDIVWLYTMFVVFSFLMKKAKQ